jgi:Flp pilus assembly protein TadD/lysophospholipase L1-like esterase
MPGDEVASQHTIARRRLLPTWKKAAFGLLTSCLLLAALEGLLALLGTEPLTVEHDPLVGFSSSSPLFVPSSDSDGELATAQAKLAFFNRQQFPRQKASGTRRIICLGGSTTYGRPYGDTTSFVGWLRQLLPHADPRYQWEVINAGGISYASYRLAVLTEQLLELDPDLLIIYTGHNEFLEERTYPRSERPSLMLQQATLLAARSRIFTLIYRGLRGDPTAGSQRVILPDEVDEILNHTVGPSSYQRDDFQQDQVIRHFQLNLSRISRMARRRGVPLLMVTPAANLRDFSPFKSQFSEAVSAADRKQWQLHIDKARLLQVEEDWQAARQQLEAAQQLDPRQATTHFQLGHLLLKQGESAAALAAFRRARDEDVCPLRALSPVVESVRQAARREGDLLVDFEQLLAEQTQQTQGHRIPGNELFLDHVHPSIDAQQLLAEAIIDRLGKASWLSLAASWTPELRQQVSLELKQSLDRLDHARARRNLAKVLNWAGKHMEAGQLATSVLDDLPRDPESLSIASAYMRQLGRLPQAIELMRRRLAETPVDLDSLRRLGSLLVDNGQARQALEPYQQVVKLAPRDAESQHHLGILLLELGELDQALLALTAARQLEPSDANIHYHLGIVLARRGELSKAAASLRRALQLDPDDEDARYNLDVLQQQLRSGQP